MRRRHFGSVRKLPSGHYQASYWHDGRRYTADETFRAKSDALAYLSRIETDLHRGAWLDPMAGRMTVAALSALWLESNSQKRPSTRTRDETILRRHVLPVLGSRLITKVTPQDIQQLVDSWAGAQAPSTVSRQYTCMAAVFTFGVDSERLSRTPCRRIRLPRVPEKARPELTANQLDRLSSQLGSDQATMMWLSVVAGLRFAECAGLTVDRLDLIAATVTIDRQLLRDGTLTEPKTAKGRRTVAIPLWLAEDLAGVLARRGLTGADGDAFVFVSSNGARLHYPNWRRRIWRPACARADLADLVFHDLRSLAATALVATGADLKTAQRRLGHSSVKVTLDIYARATAAADRRAAELVGDYLRPSRANSSPLRARSAHDGPRAR